jgi:hypothetical protein
MVGMESWKRIAAAIMVLSVAGTARVLAKDPQVSQTAQTEAAALKQFEQGITQYMALRESLTAEKITGPVPSSTAPELNRASDTLAAAIQRARSNARPGDIFVPAVTPVLKQRIIDVVRQENLGPVLAGIDDELKTAITPTVHLRFPVSAPMATMPPSLLAALPPLPKFLEYRIVGKFLVLRDVEAALIIDFIPAVVPR